MCVPGKITGVDGEHTLSQALTDLEDSRETVIEEVLRAPERRIDNMVTKLADRHGWFACTP